jgi:hypothetical protein
MAASTDQKSATASIAAVNPVRYEMAISFPFLIILLLVKHHVYRCEPLRVCEFFVKFLWSYCEDIFLEAKFPD